VTIATNESDLWARYKKEGDESARDDLILHYMGVVRFVAGRMAIHVPTSVELDDLISWGVLGLLDAVEKFEPEKGLKFSTYATVRIRGAIIDEIRSLDWAPRSLRAMARKIGSARERLRHELGGEPSVEAIAEAIDVEPGKVSECLAQLQTAQVLSLDDYLPNSESEESRKLDIVEDSGIRTPGSEAEAQERQERLVQAILGLPEQQQKVLNLYYYEELTLKEIGAVLEVSESRVCQVHSAALKTLREAARTREE
jgi:RNA polymerase sigma factor for flagellar operon FliA